MKAKRAILHIPHTEMLVLKSIQEWMNLFADNRHARNTPTEVVLPAVTLGGPSFQSVVQPYPSYLEPPKNSRTGTHIRPFKLLGDWVEDCREIDSNLKVWACINAVYGFLSNEFTHVVNQRSATLDDNMCLTNPVIHHMTDDLIEEILEFNVDGFVFDITDIYPQTGSNNAIDVDNTCFCSHCMRALEEEGFHHDFEVFLGETNPFRLVLQVTDSGTANIPVNLEWSPSYLVKLSHERGFITDKSTEIEKEAQFLLDYMKARSNVVAKSIKRICEKARENEKNTAVIMGDYVVDLSTMTDIPTLQRIGAVGEYWCPSIDSNYVRETKVQVCSYLWSRGTYSVNAFFETFEAADTIVAIQGVEALLGRLQNRAKRLLGTRLQPGNVYAVSRSDEYVGYIGIPLDRQETISLVQLLSQRIVGSVLPDEIITAMFGKR